MQNSSLRAITLADESATDRDYENHVIANVNDHAVHISVMTQAYHWHCHPDSDETFLALEGSLMIDLDDRTIELNPGQLFTIDRGVRHRTRPAGARSVNLTFERRDAASQPLAPPVSECAATGGGYRMGAQKQRPLPSGSPKENSRKPHV